MSSVELAGIIPTLIALAAVTVLVIMEIRFSAGKTIIFGLIPMMIVAVLIGGICVCGAVAQKNHDVSYDRYEMSRGFYADIYMQTDGNGRTVAFSPLEIRDKDGVLVDQTDILTSDYKDEDSQYKEIIAYFIGKHNLKGESVDTEDVRKSIIFRDGSTYASFRLSSLFRLLFICEIPLLVILILGKLRIRYKQKKAELKKLEIELGL